MIVNYVIEIWNTEHNKYIPAWSGDSFDRAEIMMNKSYYARYTRRLIMKSCEVLYTEKKSKFIDK